MTSEEIGSVLRAMVSNKSVSSSAPPPEEDCDDEDDPFFG